MKTILVADDMRIFREAIAAALNAAGYRTLSASDGAEAIDTIRTTKPDLVLLDIGMPVLDGLAVLHLLRSDAGTRELPVILLTALSDKEKVIEAGKLGIRDYLLKSRFSLAELMEKVKLRLANGVCGAVAQSSVSVAPVQGPMVPVPPAALRPPVEASSPPDGGQKCAPQAVPKGLGGNTESIPQLLTRGACLSRVTEALEGKALSEVVSQVVSMANSPKMDTAQLAALIGRDPALAVNVLRVANSAVYATRSGPRTTIVEAVRNIGASSVRNIAAAMSVFDAMPLTAPDGFNPIRWWQHSFAVARLCEHLAACEHAEDAGVAYLVGLCHDLVQILFRTQFGKEYAQVLAWEASSGKERLELEKAMLGVERQELVVRILSALGLPDIIRNPIVAFHTSTSVWPANGSGWMVRLLQVAELYANGLLLAAGTDALVAPLATAQCQAATGQEHPQILGAQNLRSEVLTMTAMLVRRPDETKLMARLYPSSRRQVCLVRDASFSTFDPIETAIGSIAAAMFFEQIPPVETLQQFDSLVIVSDCSSMSGLSAGDLGQIRSQTSDWDLDVIWLIPGNEKADAPAGVTVLTWPTTLDRLAAALGVGSSEAQRSQAVRAAAA